MTARHIERFAVIFLICTLLIVCTIQFLPTLTVKNKRPKNVIFLVGDGMGFSYVTAYRYFKNINRSSISKMKETEFDSYFVGTQMTYPNDKHENITDSAAAATAMATGVKTYNNAIGVDNEFRPIKNLIEQAKEEGKSTGLVVTSELAHATPAGFSVHNISRLNMNAIADSYYDDRINGKHKVDVFLGGGAKNFIRDDRNVVKEFQKDGYSYVSNREMLFKDRNRKVLGLFASKGLDKMIDRSAEIPSLAEMAGTAIERLKENHRGFFLLVEGSQIDWGGHNNDIVTVMSEMTDFEKAFKKCIDFAKKDNETLVIATADHSTGGLTVGSNGSRNYDATFIHSIKRTPYFIAEKITKGGRVEDLLKKYIHLTLTKNEIQSIKNVSLSKDVKLICNKIKEIINVRSHTGWTTNFHTGEDVPVYAFGPWKEQWSYLIENIDHAKKIQMLSGK